MSRPVQVSLAGLASTLLAALIARVAGTFVVDAALIVLSAVL